MENGGKIEAAGVMLTILANAARKAGVHAETDNVDGVNQQKPHGLTVAEEREIDIGQSLQQYRAFRQRCLVFCLDTTGYGPLHGEIQISRESIKVVVCFVVMDPYIGRCSEILPMNLCHT